MKHAWILPVLLLLAAPALGMFMMPENVPVDRLAKNVAAYAKRHPRDPHAWYVLGRVHSLAVYLGATEIGVWGAGREGGLPTVDHQFHEPGEGEKPTPEQLRRHVIEALKAFDKALALAPDDARTILGIAYTLEGGAAFAEQPPPTEVLEPASVEDLQRFQALVKKLGAATAAEREAAEQELAAAGRKAWPALGPHLDGEDPERRLRVRRLLARLWTEAATRKYRKAFDLAIQDDLALPHLPIQGVTQLAAHEAGGSWLRLVKARGVKPEEHKQVETTEIQVRSLQGKPRGAITPIVFPLDRPRALASLLRPDHRVHFDLDGDLAIESWPWVRGDTGILVWDPEAEGRITSGRQLFGTATWWMLFRDGYQALDALDDDRDGRVAGEELTGLAVWCDRNENGTSEPGEVIPVGRWGIVGLQTRPVRHGPAGPAHPSGLELADGRALPTYDWTLPPAARR